MDFLLQWIAQYGYAAIFVLLVLGIVGLPVPDEWLLTFTGYLVYRKQLLLIPAAGSALAGSVCGITISFLLGRWVGLHFLLKHGSRFHITPERVELAHRWFQRIGRWTLAIGYFIPGVRHVTAYLAGFSELEFPTFAVFAYSGAVIWCATFIGFGYLAGEHWDEVSRKLDRAAFAAAAVAAIAGAAYFLWRRRRSRES